jgi:hypothetical protein
LAGTQVNCTLADWGLRNISAVRVSISLVDLTLSREVSRVDSSVQEVYGRNPVKLMQPPIGPSPAVIYCDMNSPNSEGSEKSESSVSLSGLSSYVTELIGCS